MPTLTVGLKADSKHVQYTPGQSLGDILEANGVGVRTGCLVMGACGLCRVRIESGDAGEPTQNERVHLSEGQLAEGVRLACQVFPREDLRLTVLAEAPISEWKRLHAVQGRSACAAHSPMAEGALQRLAGNGRDAHGVAIDLGTTHITLLLFNLHTGKCLAGRYGMNPQGRISSDIMSRLVFAGESSENAETLRVAVVEAIGGALGDIASRDGIELARVARLALVGNSAMVALLSGCNFGRLLKPGQWMEPLDCLPDPETTAAWAAEWGIHPQAEVVVLPPVAGFVGSDLLAGILATGMTDDPAGTLLIDFGTNTEIALWDGASLWVTSASGGPAFEGGMGCTMPAEPGAIHRVELLDGEYSCSVIGNVANRALCGSGLVDLVACLVRAGDLNDKGQFGPRLAQGRFNLQCDSEEIVLAKRDVDAFQHAKAAIGVGVEVLLARAGLGGDDLGRICVGGMFGRFLDVANARQVGLLPRSPRAKVELSGNCALAGCEQVLFSPEAEQRMEALRQQAAIVNLAQCPDFEDLFLKNLYLRPV